MGHTFYCRGGVPEATHSQKEGNSLTGWGRMSSFWEGGKKEKRYA